MNLSRTLTACVAALTLAAGTLNSAYASGADDFGAGIVLPASSDLITIARAAEIAQAQLPDGLILRIKLEVERGRWIYRAESTPSTAWQRVRTDIDARTGQVLRVKRNGMGGGDKRDAQAILRKEANIQVTYAKAAEIAAQASGGKLVTDLRLQVEGNTLVYKATAHAAASRSEVRIHVTTGAVLRVSTEGSSGSDDNGGSSGGSSGSSGGSSGNSGGGSGGGSGGSGGNPVLTGQADTLADAIAKALAGQPAGTAAIEAKFKRQNMTLIVEVLAGVPGSAIGQETKFNPATGAASRERERLDAGDLAVLNGFTRALKGQPAIGFARAMEIAVGSATGEVSAVEIGLRGTTPIYEVKVLSGARVISVKINALSGAVLSS